MMLSKGIYHFDNKPFIVKAWSPEMEFTREELHTVSIWIKFLGLDFKYWSPKGLSKIRSLIGKPLMVDENTERKTSLHFARLLIKVEMDTTLPDKVWFRNEKGALVEQKIIYDWNWKPTLCAFCNKYGHAEDECRKTKSNVSPVKARRENPADEGTETTQMDMQKPQVQDVRSLASQERGKQQQTEKNDIGTKKDR